MGFVFFLFFKKKSLGFTVISFYIRGSFFFHTPSDQFCIKKNNFKRKDPHNTSISAIFSLTLSQETNNKKKTIISKTDKLKKENRDRTTYNVYILVFFISLPLLLPSPESLGLNHSSKVVKASHI